MSTPNFPFGMDPESLRDAPLFQELQRVMSGSSGPFQWEADDHVRRVSVAVRHRGRKRVVGAMGERIAVNGEERSHRPAKRLVQ